VQIVSAQGVSAASAQCATAQTIPRKAFQRNFNNGYVLLWTPAQRKRASMLYFANVFFIYLFFFFMAALFSGPG